MQDLTALHTLVFNSLEEQIAVIDQQGTVIDVNRAWCNFGNENGLSSKYSSVGSNYIEVLSASVATGDSLAGEALQGIIDVINGNRDSFYFEYPCNSEDEKRWFMMRVTGLVDVALKLFVISHKNITLRKLAEERVEYLAMHDPLTGLANRRYFNNFIKQEIRRSIRNQSTISLVVVDVDYFKEYNDKLGHPAGDQCLINVSQALQTLSRRPSDLAARIGGDEFALILGDTDYLKSQNIAKEIQKEINDLSMVIGGARQLTVSVGAVSVIPHKQQDVEFLLQEADKALYQAKLAGRNRVVHVKPDINNEA